MLARGMFGDSCPPFVQGVVSKFPVGMGMHGDLAAVKTTGGPMLHGYVFTLPFGVGNLAPTGVGRVFDFPDSAVFTVVHKPFLICLLGFLASLTYVGSAHVALWTPGVLTLLCGPLFE